MWNVNVYLILRRSTAITDILRVQCNDNHRDYGTIPLRNIENFSVLYQLPRVRTFSSISRQHPHHGCNQRLNFLVYGITPTHRIPYERDWCKCRFFFLRQHSISLPSSKHAAMQYRTIKQYIVVILWVLVRQVLCTYRLYGTVRYCELWGGGLTRVTTGHMLVVYGTLIYGSRKVNNYGCCENPAAIIDHW